MQLTASTTVALGSLLFAVALPVGAIDFLGERGPKVRTAPQEATQKPRAAFPALASAVATFRAAERARSSSGNKTECGKAPTYPNAKPKNYADSRETKYDSVAKQTVPVVFVAGDKVEFACESGFTTDGSKDGNSTFNAECSEHGYYKTESVCVEASKCGKVPTTPHALPTGTTNRGNVEMKCTNGYSLDGEKVVAGGMGKNQLFNLECVEFSGEFKNFTGECIPFGFVPGEKTIRIYNNVFEALFVVSCKGTLQEKFGKAEELSLGSVCDSFEDSKASCSSLVTAIEGDYTSKAAELESHDAGSEKDWYDEKDAGRPNITQKADKFCKDLWGLLELPSM